MTKEKILAVAEYYREMFVHHDVGKEPFPHDELFTKNKIPRGDAHCHYMLGKIDEFVHDDRIEKVFRWLGFLQGYLFATGQFTIGELEDHNRP